MWTQQEAVTVEPAGRPLSDVKSARISTGRSQTLKLRKMSFLVHKLPGPECFSVVASTKTKTGVNLITYVNGDSSFSDKPSQHSALLLFFSFLINISSLWKL